MSDSDESAVMVDLNDDDGPPELKDEETEDEGVVSSPTDISEENATKEDESNKKEEESNKKKEEESIKKKEEESNKKKEEEEKPTSQSTYLDGAHASQVVSIGTEEDAYAFTFHKDRWDPILGRVPPGWKVAVVSVVGAFRTGKSFLLSWFLRYMYALERTQKGDHSDDTKKPWYEQFGSLGKDGFDWRAGTERNTTGIWMWSHPFFIQNSAGENMAVLLVDTQGMFDHETTMKLTASIFGLSTLLSSYQIYNVDKQIQEDNLQQLALFTEYARFVMGKGEQDRKPFQKVEFLVRDWQHFDEEDEDDFEAMEKSMEAYLSKVLASREASDLKDTREQIQGCFEEISCYGLCHPGFAVTKKKYTGDVKVLEKMFVTLLDRYCKRVFDSATLQPKVIAGRELAAAELGTFVKGYSDLFSTGENFPTAATLLEATTLANNNNAVALSLAEYKDLMDRVAGPKCSNYIKNEEMLQEHQSSQAKAFKKFRSVATFGSRKSVEVAQKQLSRYIEESWQVYESLNNGRNPLLGLETYLLPMAIAFVAYLLRWFTDMTCSPYSQYCKAGSEALSHLYAIVFCFLAILAATKMKQIQEMFGRIQTAVAVVMDAKPKKD